MRYTKEITDIDRAFFLLGVHIGEENAKAEMVELAKLAEPGRERNGTEELSSTPQDKLSTSQA